MSHQDDLQGLLITMRELIQKPLEVGSIQRRSFQQKAFAGRGLDRSIHIKGLTAILPRSQRLHAGQRDAPSLNRQQPKATFIQAEEAPRALSRWWQHGLALETFRLQEGCNLFLKGRGRFRGF
jgi:hypothetical protein